MHPRHPNSAEHGETSRAAGGRVAVHPGATPVAEQWPVPARERAVHRRREGGEDDLAAVAADPDDPVAVRLAEIFDVSAGGFEDPQREQAQQAKGAKRQQAADDPAAANPLTTDIAGTPSTA